MEGNLEAGGIEPPNKDLQNVRLSGFIDPDQIYTLSGLSGSNKVLGVNADPFRYNAVV
jgi:hypothetical protein